MRKKIKQPSAIGEPTRIRPFMTEKECIEQDKKEPKTCKLKDVYKLLHARPFCNCAIKEAYIYEAYCLRIIETLER